MCNRKKGKVIPLQAQCGPEGILLLFHDRGTTKGWEVSSMPRPHFTPGKDLVPILQLHVWLWYVITSTCHKPSTA